MQRHRNGGFTLMELLMVILVIMIMSSVAGAQYAGYLDRVGPEHTARTVGTYVSLTRSFAIRRRAPVSLVLDGTDKKLWIRTTADTIQSLNLGESTEFRSITLTMGFPGDSLTFSPRGVCRECGLTGNGDITVSGRNEVYVVTFNALGVWKVVRQQ